MQMCICGRPSRVYCWGQTMSVGMYTLCIVCTAVRFRRLRCYNAFAMAAQPRKLPLPLGGSKPSSNKWFLGFTWVRNPNGISIGSAVLAQLIVVSSRQTDHATSIAIGHILFCIAMRCGLRLRRLIETNKALFMLRTNHGPAASQCTECNWRR